ncbi:hypothetical protein COOONC_18635 [Cooperia oncophora]
MLESVTAIVTGQIAPEMNAVVLSVMLGWNDSQNCSHDYMLQKGIGIVEGTSHGYA